MIRLSAAAFASVLFLVPVLTAAVPAVTAVGLIGLALAAVGIATRWRWPVTAAACLFLTDYAAALWLAGASASVAGASGFGLSLLLLLQSTELARCVHQATADAGLARSQIFRWCGFAAATLAVTSLAMPVATALAALMPFAAAPVAAAAGALGVVLALATTVLHPRR